MDTPQEFHYRLPGRVSGQRPGSHPGSSIGAGQEFVTHLSLYDRPDPRRLDLHASLRAFNDDWLVRVNRQRAGAAVRALVDVSASMNFGGEKPKLEVVADFLEALGLSAFRVGDAVGMMAFDEAERPELFMPARVSRGMGSVMAAAMRELCEAGDTRVTRTPRSDIGVSDGIEDAASRLAGQQGLVFLVSDFHWPLERLHTVLDLLAHAGVVPVVVWDPAETRPPTRNSLASLRDAESGARRTFWLRPKFRDEWRQAVARRRAEIDSFFAAHSIRPFYIEGTFDAEALSRYFFEAAS
ncbi:MAG TPA: hypothetical protein VGC34_00235 [Steroidobacteraceae bacterium]